MLVRKIDGVWVLFQLVGSDWFGQSVNQDWWRFVVCCFVANFENLQLCWELQAERVGIGGEKLRVGSLFLNFSCGSKNRKNGEI